jgi:hypothetical protein
MTRQNRRLASLIGPMVFALIACGCGGGGGGGGHHHGGGGGGSGNNFSCTSGTAYFGDQVGGGDEFGWCVAHNNNSFSFTDLTLNGSPTNGGFAADATFVNLLGLTVSASAGTALEMPNTQLLVSPGNLITGVNANNNAVVLISKQAGFCPPAGSNYNFVTLPKSGWFTTNPAYGTVSLASGSLGLTVKDINGNSMGNENDSYTCDSSTSFLTFTQSSNGKVRTVATSPQGLFVDTAGSGGAGLLQATSNVGSTVAAGTFLGLIYQPDGTNKVQVVGFRPGGCAAPLCGFDPSTAGQPSNGMTLIPGAESTPGLFTGGTFVDTNTDSPFVVVANTVMVNGTNKVVLYGITFDSTANTAVSVLLLEQ